ncbi:hypothetical protein M436DRAFT_66165 [Aureobasidium namibiae CBS 147.97]|uniref:Uncharacterized protein n=1 Tax=Aureobasidium namibiae CBS 147.97 TaxID=1043004 RepID=A0A074WGL1_9PEZI
MPGSHDLSVENLRLHEHIVDSQKHTQHVVKTVTTAPTARHGARPPAKPETVARSKAPSKASSQAGSKRGEAIESSKHEKEVLIITVIEEGGDEDLPPKAPSVAHASSKHESKKAPSVEPPASRSSHHSHHSHRQSKDIFHIPAGIPPPPGFARMPDLPVMPSMVPVAEIPAFDMGDHKEMALIMIPPPPARSVASGASKLVAQRYPASHVSHRSKSSHASKKSSKSKAPVNSSNESELVDVLVEEVHEVTKRRYVVKMPRDKARDFKFAD